MASETVTGYNEALVGEAMEAMGQVFRMVERTAMPLWVQLDLTMAQAKAAMFLAHEGPMPIGGLACALGIGQPAASTLVDRLVQLGLVERSEDPIDRRRTIARLSSRGQEIVDRLRQHRMDCLRDWLGALDAQALTGLINALHTVTGAAGSQGREEQQARMAPENV